MIKPGRLAIETTTKCNLKCLGCHRYKHEGDQLGIDMPFDLFKKIIDQVNWPCKISAFSVGGEPLMCTNYIDYLRYISEHQLQYHVCTNGTIYDHDFWEEVLKDKFFQSLVFSVDGIKSETQEHCRPGFPLFQIEGNIQKVADLKASLNSKTKIGVRIVRKNQDEQEVEDFIEHWCSIVDFVSVGTFFSQVKQQTRYADCQSHRGIVSVIKPNGDVLLCERNCYAPVIGNVNKDPILDIYNNSYSSLYRDYEHFVEPCRSCSNPCNGYGYEGTVTHRKTGTIYNHRSDYFNHYYSRGHIGEI